jgi:DNA modification methylase
LQKGHTSLNHQSDIQEIITYISNICRKNDLNTQSILNIEKKTRASLFPWRGQFSPQLIEYILQENTQPGYCILDPFCGSGTTLYESARLNLSCYGIDIHPAAHLFSSIVSFCRLNHLERENILAIVCNLAQKNIVCSENTELFALLYPNSGSFTEQLLNFYQDCQKTFFTYLIATVSIMIAMGNSENTTVQKFFKSLNTVVEIIKNLPYTNVPIYSFLTDARYLNLPKSSFDLIVTSPPYINVFNYHQNYRQVLEFLNWQPLQVAVSEIGANRKHRANRFLTVIQYCMDMCTVFLEMRQVLRETGKVIIVVGRTSSVRSVNFQNSYLLAMVATGCAGFKIEKWQERCFTNRFGEKIYEDILRLSINHQPHFDYLNLARSIGIWSLKNAICQNAEVQRDIEQAISTADKVTISPKLNLQIPSKYDNLYQSFYDYQAKEISKV